MSYNGWKNQATWQVNLEFFDGMGFNEFSGTTQDELVDEMYEIVDTYLDENTNSYMAYMWARERLLEVDFHEIAAHILEDV